MNCSRVAKLQHYLNFSKPKLEIFKCSAVFDFKNICETRLVLLQNKRSLSTFLPLSTCSNRSRSLDEQIDSDGYFVHVALAPNFGLFIKLVNHLNTY
ncbi:hypothetical protein BpHYR1_022414 [Brachionus plicatilis]|uniref:Uncharacterized protein n=1 Tax=Brachionus plicatilis TaxID=10195 RepID=A0A3M7QBM6_BRAPC|nr:hypothetical protein BpHYR1_022414 [Brachionus plicatilis]